MAMAKVTLACSICGNEYTVSKRCYNRKDADSFEEHMKKQEGKCPDCFAIERRTQESIERAQAAEQAAIKAKKLGFAKLEGSAKQVSWAETLRWEILDRIGRQVTGYTFQGEEITKENTETLSAAVKKFFESEVSAKLFIENRDASKQAWYDIIGGVKSEPATPSEIKIPKSITEATENTAEPESRKYPGVAYIRLTYESVTARYEKNEAFILLLKSLGYTWDGHYRVWEKKITPFTGSTNDRAAELGNALLRAGFAIRIDNDDIRARAISGEFAPECTRWIKFASGGIHAGSLVISWPKGQQDIYNAARQIRGSRWASPSVIVPIESYQEVEDFADIMDFQISDGAQKAIQAYKDAKNPPIIPVAPVIPEPEDKLGKILESSTDVLPDLEDK